MIQLGDPSILGDFLMILLGRSLTKKSYEPNGKLMIRHTVQNDIFDSNKLQKKNKIKRWLAFPEKVTPKIIKRSKKMLYKPGKISFKMRFLISYLE